MGGDEIGAAMTGIALKFQSTPPYGGRRPLKAGVGVGAGFNPRPRMGGDHTFQLLTKRTTSFNPRPRMGGDKDYGNERSPIVVSIHAPVWGATSVVAPSVGDTCFNPRPRMGGDCSTCN